jgi:D-alanyl-D-alanine carboxypeptidase
MTRQARRTPSAWIIVAMAVGALLVAPTQAGATTTRSGHQMAVVPAPQRIDPGELRRLLDQIVAAGAPGAAALVRDEHGVQQAASGLADLRTGRPMRPKLNYRVASVTKPFVATVVLQQVAEGRLSLSDTVERWLPGILPYGGQVSIRQLLNNTSGVPEYLLVPLLELYESKQGRFRSWTPRELVALVAGQSPLFPPGTTYSYSNTNYVLAGLIVEAATGRTLGQELKRRIIRPLGLGDTFFPVNRPDIPGRNARGYSLPLGDQGPVLDGPLLDFTVYNPSLAWAAGNVVSDLGDLTRFFRALLGGRLLPRGLLTEMTTTVPIGQGAGYGLGLLVVETPCGRLIGHDGGIPGFITIVLGTQDGRRQFGIMVNEFFTTPAVDQAYGQVVVEIAMGLLEGGSCDPAASSASLGTAVRAGELTHTQETLALSYLRLA